MDVISGSVGRTSSSEAKIALFRSLFRGRDDVYPRRFESRKTGWAGYAPACANEWVRGVCEKPRIKCAECPNRRFLPVTDDVIRRYLSGADAEGQPFVAGVYPLLQDETCFFLAVDFDKTGWRDDAAAFLETCGDLQRFRATKGESSWRLQVKLLRVLQEGRSAECHRTRVERLTLGDDRSIAPSTARGHRSTARAPRRLDCRGLRSGEQREHAWSVQRRQAIDAIRKRFGGESVDYGSAVRGGRSVPDEFRRLAEREL